MHDVALIDGIAAAGDRLNERGFQFGDGLFETIAVIDQRPCLWDAHMARLALGCHRLSLPPPDIELLAAEAGSLCRGRAKAVLKLYWTAGDSARGYARPRPLAARRMLRCSDWPYPVTPRSWSLRQCRHRLSENAALARIKHLNRLDQVMARAEWDDAATGEGIMLGQDGRVVCGTMSNLFIQQGGLLLTPAIEGAGIAGVVRGLALELAARRGDRLEQVSIGVDQLRCADALYLTNSLIGVVRAARFETTVFDPGIVEHPLMRETRRLCHQPQLGAEVDE